MKKILLGAAALLSLTNSIAQTKLPRCGSDEMKAYYMRTLPGYKEQVEAVEASNLVSKIMVDTTTTYTIPVVFHVLHTGQAIGTGPNVSDALITNIINYLNEDFGRLSSDTVDIDPKFDSLYKDIKVKFALAKKDPLGNCTNGIIRHYDENTLWDQQTAIFNYKYSTNAADSWKSSKYMNIYLVSSIASGDPNQQGYIVGYTYKPGQSPTVSSDAIVYRYDALYTKDEVRSLSHEVGHWLNLAHTFGNSNSAGGPVCGDDGVLDTPPTKGFFSTCPDVTNNFECSSIRPNIQNIMDYSDCPKMFTRGQRDKMRTSIVTNSSRINLVSGANMIATGIDNPNPTPCAPIADFSFSRNITCAGQSINYVNTSYNGSLDTYTWTFTGGTPSTSNNLNETVVYAAPGEYPVSLTVANGQGQSTKTYTNVSIQWNAYDVEVLPYVETFDNGLPAGWKIVNKDFGSVAWEVVEFNKDTLNASNPGKCMALLNASTPGNFDEQYDILETRVYNFSNVTSVGFSFDYSAPIKPEISNKDSSLVLEYSLDCGGKWDNFIASGSNFPMDSIMAKNTAGTLNTPYFPLNSTVGKWATFAPSGTALTFINTKIANKNDVKFRLKYQTNQSTAQNLFIDNFRISGVVGIEELANTIGLSIYPNPTSSTSTIEFTSPVNSNVEVLVMDITGRLVEKSTFKTDAGLASKYVVNKNSNLTAGMYVVSLILDGQKVTKKLIIN